MLRRLGDGFSRVARRVVPDPFVLAVLLTLLVVALGVWRAGASGQAEPFAAVLGGWIDGFTSAPLLAFALQMCLVLVTGHAVATSPYVQHGVKFLATRAWSPRSASAFVAAVSCGAAVLHWGLGAIVGAFLAREMGRHARAEGRPIHYPALGAAGYAGLAVWHGGISGSAPLKVAEEGHFVAELVGVIPVSETLFSPLNVLVTGALCVLLPALFYWMTPTDGDAMEPAPDLPPPRAIEAEEERGAGRVVTFLQDGALVASAVAIAGLAAAMLAYDAGAIGFDLNLVNLVFLFAGVMLHGSLRRYAAAIGDGAKGVGGIVLQFPFYFGILGVMKAAGMIAWISDLLVSVATPGSFPAVAFLSAGVVNFFVPSGGGQWAVQGEILMSAANELGVDPATVVMAFSYGDAWTNMLQPFWALPLLGIMQLRAKDIVGYTAVVCVVMGVVVPLLLMAF